MRGDPMRQGQKRPQPGALGLPKGLDLDPGIRTTDDRAQGNGHNVQQLMPGCGADPRIVQRGEMGQNAGWWQRHRAPPSVGDDYGRRARSRCRVVLSSRLQMRLPCRRPLWPWPAAADAAPNHVSTRASAAAAQRRFYYGWVVVGTLATTETISWGIIYYAFTAFLVPMQQELGWSTAALTGAYSLALLVSGLAAVPVGRWVDRHGPRLLMTLGSLGGTMLLLAWARIDSLPGFYLVWAVMGLVMATTLYEPAFTVVTTWFRRLRSRALLLLTFVAGFASTIFLPISTLLIEHLGWRQALLVLAAFLAVTTIPAHALILRRRPEDLGLLPDGDARPEGPPTTASLPIEGVTLRRA